MSKRSIRKAYSVKEELRLLHQQQFELAKNVMILDKNFNTLLELYKKSVLPIEEPTIEEK